MAFNSDKCNAYHDRNIETLIVGAKKRLGEIITRLSSFGILISVQTLKFEIITYLYKTNED